MQEQMTKEGIVVRVGQVWRDLDKRMGERHCMVVAVEREAVRMSPCRPDGSEVREWSTRVSIRRMHKGSTGWALVKDVPAAATVD